MSLFLREGKEMGRCFILSWIRQAVALDQQPKTRMNACSIEAATNAARQSTQKLNHAFVRSS